jgi:hypothetical protein
MWIQTSPRQSLPVKGEHVYIYVAVKLMHLCSFQLKITGNKDVDSTIILVCLLYLELLSYT